jgi:hypothetical protein
VTDLEIVEAEEDAEERAKNPIPKPIP